MPVVKVTAEGEPDRVVRAKSKQAAIGHVVNGKYTANIMSTDDLADLFEKGVKIEDAREEEKVVESDDAEAPLPPLTEDSGFEQ